MNRQEFETALLKSQDRSERFPEDHVCPRSVENGCGPNSPFGDGKAIWCIGDSCSYCGSLHPAVLMERLEEATITVEPTDKNYKIYVVTDADTPKFKRSFRADGSPVGDDPSKWVWTVDETNHVKFYFQHLSSEQQQRFVELINEKKIKFALPGYFYVLPFFVSMK